MSYRSHEFPYQSNDPKQLIDRALRDDCLVHITYQDLGKNTTRRTIKPIEWVEDYKIKAYCHLRNEERSFVLSGIREISLIVQPDGTANETKQLANTPPNRTAADHSYDGAAKTRTHSVPSPGSSVSGLDQWRAARGEFTRIERKAAPKKTRIDSANVFSQVTNSEQWRQLISYYSECLNREFLQDYIINQKKHADYHFFPDDDNAIWHFLVGNSTLSFSIDIDGQPSDLAQFITDSTRREQQLCVGFPCLLTPDGEIAPLFFTPCEFEQKEDEIQLSPDEYELSYAILHSLNMDKEEFAAIVDELNWDEYDDLATKAKSFQMALVEKLGELIGHPVERREANQSKLTDPTNELLLYITPCLFWASKNRITSSVIEELDMISRCSWSESPESITYLLNSSPSGSYPEITPFRRDKRVYATRINDEQRRSVQAASTLPMTVVTGPPGTGKSQLVMNIIANAVMEGKSVLFASRNNRAVDVVVERMKNEMRFPGIVRTGNRYARQEAADAMLDALSRSAQSHTKTNPKLLMSRYLTSKDTLAKRLELLDEIQRLKKTLTKKTQQFDVECQGLVPQLADSLRDRRISIPLDASVAAKKSAASLVETLVSIQKRKEDVESVLQEHLADNQHGHSLIDDLEVFEAEWGAFGNGLRNVDYFTTLERLHHHIKLWLHLVDAVPIQLLIEKATSDIDEVKRKLDALVKTLSAELRLNIEDIALKATKEQLKNLNTQIQDIDAQLVEAQRRSLKNWFGLRRGPQIRAIASSFNVLLRDIDQPTIDGSLKLSELKSQFQIIHNYVFAILYTRSLKVRGKRLEQAHQKLSETLDIFSDRTRQQFMKLELQPAKPVNLRNLLSKLLKEVEKYIQQRQHVARNLDESIGECESLSDLWSTFQSVVGGDEYPEWSFDDEIDLAILEHFASQWSAMLSAAEIKSEIDQLADTIQKKGDEGKINDSIENIQRELTSNAAEILNNTWLQNVDRLPLDRVKRVRDYASLIKEIAENYSSLKYANMREIQETHTDDLIEVFPIWATTNLSIKHNLPLRPELFDVVIIDEASQCDIPSALPLLYRSKQVVIIGDAMQLRHIATLMEDSHQSLAAEYNIATEAYSYTQHSLFDLASRSVGQHPGILMLKEHYRSHEHIISFSNQMFYDGHLVIKTNMTNRQIPKQILRTSCGVFWLNTPGEAVHPSGGSAKNHSEINAIKQLLPPIHQNLTSNGWDASIGVVTPYREQRNAIQSWVDSQFGQQITVGTAHTFQGDEREILLFSPVLAPGISDGSLSWLKRTKNLLNVAITRARTTLIIVGDFNFCMSLSADNPYRQLAEYVRARPGSVYQSWQSIPLANPEAAPAQLDGLLKDEIDDFNV
jgi:hypothetical protein